MIGSLTDLTSDNIKNILSNYYGIQLTEEQIFEIVKDPAHLAHFNLLIQDLSAMARAMFNTKNKIDRQ
jgi:hypothetical protein